MKYKLISMLLVLSLVIPVTVNAEGDVFDGKFESEEVLSLGHYDVATRTETTEEISLSDLKMRNDATKQKLGISGNNVLCGFNPVLGDSVLYGDENIALPRTTPGTYPQTTVNVNNYPYTAIMFLFTGMDKNGDGTIESWGTGSGFLVDSDVMITAAHCFIGKGADGNNRFIDECRIFPRYASSSISQNTTGYYHPQSWSYSTVYMSSSNVEHDWLVATLASPIGNQHGYFAVRDWDASIAGVTATTGGYPAESSSKRYYQHKSTGPLKSYSTKRMSFIMDIERGNSGGPVYVSGNQVIGIITGAGTEANWALRIFEALYEVIENRCLAN